MNTICEFTAEKVKSFADKELMAMIENNHHAWVKNVLNTIDRARHECKYSIKVKTPKGHRELFARYVSFGGYKVKILRKELLISWDLD